MNRDSKLGEDGSNDGAFNGLALALIAPAESTETVAALERQGGDVTLFSFGENEARDSSIAEFANRILTADIEVVVFVTGVGVESLVEQATRTVDRDRFINCLQDVTTVAGTTKAEDALNAIGVKPSLSVGPAYSWRDILMAVDRDLLGRVHG